MSLATLQQLRTGQLKGIKRLDLSCGLTEFPAEIFDLADTLEVLNLTGNQLSRLPDDLWRLSKMQIIFCSDNLFTELPAVLGSCPALTMIGFKANQIQNVPNTSLPKTLRWLVLTDNQITALPETIGDCTQLQKLMLAGNRLSDLPIALAKCQRLELIRLAANHLPALPAVLLQLPRLSWLAIGGNPFNAQLEAEKSRAHHLPEISWPRLTQAGKLGEGASGAIYQVQYQQDGVTSDAALKLFKGHVTSDGLPQTEMAVCRAAGAHEHLIGVVAQLVDHPNQVPGLLVPLIAKDFTVLAQPPSLSSCTRDVYAQDAVFELNSLLKIAHSIASAAAHLHANQIVHGDLYAHNILRDDTGCAYLGDFGAAAFYDHEATWAAWVQRIEVRAFACLLAELIDRMGPQSADFAVQTSLLQLQQRCAQDEVLERPSFAEIAASLREML